MFTTCLCLLLFMVSILSAEKCHTEVVPSGDCIPLPQCPSLHKLIQKLPIPRETAGYLRKAQCKSSGNQPFVCCPDGSSSSGIKPISSPLLPSNSVCGISLTSKILGGEETEFDEFPWMALLEYENAMGKRNFLCGGSLINSKYVLTAAHCISTNISSTNGKLVSVRLGEYNINTTEDCTGEGDAKECVPDSPVNVIVEDQIPHELYRFDDTNQYHDIALLRLQSDVFFTVYIKPICIPTTEEELMKTYLGEELTVAGWGRTENGTNSNIKRKLKVPVTDFTTCRRTYSSVNRKLDESNQLCAGGKENRDSCRGDSGGALMTQSVSKDKDVNWYAAGIVSFGRSPCGLENWPGVYTRVSNYVEWIVKTLKP